MNNLSERLQSVVALGEPRLRSIADRPGSVIAPKGDAWSRKETLGHLIDSATNNRVRFIKAALEGKYVGPVYDGVGWVKLGGYEEMEWSDLIVLWKTLNGALANVLERIPREKLAAECRVGDLQPVTLGFLIEDYILHMEHHLDHMVV